MRQASERLLQALDRGHPFSAMFNVATDQPQGPAGLPEALTHFLPGGPCPSTSQGAAPGRRLGGAVMQQCFVTQTSWGFHWCLWLLTGIFGDAPLLR